MFTGIVEEVGTISSILRRHNGIEISCSASLVVQDTRVGDSIAINGVCQTVESVDASGFSFFVSPVTEKHSTFGLLQSGSPVNLERAVRLHDRLGGHIVQGHVDCTGRVYSLVKGDNSLEICVTVNDPGYRFVVEKGSIAVNGVSLTVVQREESFFSLYIIPESIRNTTLMQLQAGDAVNLEFDILAKYVEQLVSHSHKEKKSILDIMTESGFV